MGIRFRRSVRLAPGVRMNLSKSGMSLSAGPRGAKVSVGKQGMHANVGIPGTGVYAREKISSGGRSPASSDAAPSGGDVRISLQDDGRVVFFDKNDQPLTPRYRKMVIDQMRETIQQWLEDQCDLWNKGIDQILGLHHETPAPSIPASFQPEPFTVPEPEPPITEGHGILGRFSSKRRDVVAESNVRRQEQFNEARAAWLSEKAQHDSTQEEHRRIFEEALAGRVASMESVLEHHLCSIVWPRETQVSFEVTADGRCVYLDVDLPEIEDLPRQQARIAKSGLKILVKDRSDTQRRREYVQHIHAIGFRLVGEVLHLLPTVDLVVLSGYSQRPDKATGHSRDEYLYSVKVGRSEWEHINFDDLEQVDVMECLGAMNIRRNMTKTGLLKPIDPFRIPEG